MRYSYYEYYKPTKAIETDQGIKARSKRGSFTKNWWAKRWISALERLVTGGRLQRGRTYARKGQVLSIEEKKGGIDARVQGSRRNAYKIRIALEPLTDQQWENVIDVLAERAIFTAQLLAGEMPQEIEEAFEDADVSLFPDKRGDLSTDCSCPDYANPCKHVAATHYILGEQFDEDPFLIFRLRGRAQEEILDALRARRSTQDDVRMLGEERPDYVVEKQVPPLEECLDNFWEMAEPLDHFITNIRPPVTELSVLKRLGQPAFLSEDLTKLLGPAYHSIMDATIESVDDSEMERK
ncbi:SWIM zinc finger family protein [Chloroflexi bacterium TSY]|nr:SWIM zinc finger family protein [Chloroflexi bacterium TSY]